MCMCMCAYEGQVHKLLMPKVNWQKPQSKRVSNWDFVLVEYIISEYGYAYTRIFVTWYEGKVKSNRSLLKPWNSSFHIIF